MSITAASKKRNNSLKNENGRCLKRKKAPKLSLSLKEMTGLEKLSSHLTWLSERPIISGGNNKRLSIMRKNARAAVCTARRIFLVMDDNE